MENLMRSVSNVSSQIQSNTGILYSMYSGVAQVIIGMEENNNSLNVIEQQNANHTSMMNTIVDKIGKFIDNRQFIFLLFESRKYILLWALFTHDDQLLYFIPFLQSN